MQDPEYTINQISPTTVELSQKEKQEFRDMYQEINITKEGIFKLEVNVLANNSSSNNRNTTSTINSNNVFKPQVYEKLKLKKQISSFVADEIDKILYEIDYANYGPAFDSLVKLINFMERE